MNKIETGRIDQNEGTVERMTAHHARFLKFLTARVEDTETAEDILQSAYIKAMQHGSEIRKDESSVA
jgi:RNA polymerase sigma-70 factor (ECF subfamily)